MAAFHEINEKNKQSSSKLLFYLLFICINFHFVQSQTSTEFVLTPSSLTVRVEDVAVLLQTSVSNTPISCSVLETNSTAEANTEIANPLCLSPASLIETSNWILLNPLFTTLPGTLIRVYTINVERKISNTTIASLLVISCCDTRSSGVSTSALVSITTSAIDQTTYLPPVYNNTVEISFPNPGYSNIAPCPCDLTLGRCDINCCCDQDCSEEFVAGFICIPGPFGGNYLLDDVRYCNTTQSLLGYTWHQFLCIHNTNMAFMGLFYTNAHGSLTPLTTLDQFQNKLRSVDSPTYSYAKPRSSNIYATILPSGYQQGDIVYTKENGTTWNRFFSIPQNLGGGECVRDGTVSYLEDIDSVCNVQVTRELCTNGTILDPASYVTDALIFTSVNLPVPVEVLYYCVDYTEYERSSGGADSSTTGSSLFPSRTTEGEDLLVNCTPSYGGLSLLTREVCRDSVVEVKYELKWRAEQITGVTTTIYLANVTVTNTTDGSGGLTLTQKYQSRFVRDRQNSSSVVRSGNPGYDVGLAILASADNTSFHGSPYLYLWKPVGVGLCADSEVQKIAFGRDQSSGCIVRLTVADFSDCEVLRLRFESAYESLFNTSLFVSRFGDPDDSGSDGLDIIFDNTTNSSLYSGGDESKYSGRCDNIPVRIIYQFIYSHTGVVKGYPIREILSLRIGYIRQTLKFLCVDSSSCNVTSDEAKSFPILSSATFTQISALTQTQQISPNDRRYNLTCDRNAVCWEDVLLPLTPDLYFMHPTDVVYRQLERNFIYSLLLLFVAIGLFLMSLDWNWIGKQCYQYTPV